MVRIRWWCALFAALVLTSGASGCSWILLQPAAPDYAPATADAPPDCTTSLGPAVGDAWDTIAVGGGLVALGALTLATSSEVLPGSETPAVGVGEIVGGVGLGTMFAASARWGHTAAERCRRLRDQFQTELSKRVEALESRPTPRTQ